MGPEIKLIERYKNALDNDDYLIWCNKEYNSNRFHKYDTDTILNDFLSKVTGFEIKDFPYNIQGPRGIWQKYSVTNAENSIMLCTRVINLDTSKKFRTKKNTKVKRFLFWNYDSRTYEKIETKASKDQIKYYKENGFSVSKSSKTYFFTKKVYAITIENLLFEINKDVYDELEQFTLLAIKKRSIKSIDSIK